jgi:FAD/FMN-containing dehydrogenase
MNASLTPVSAAAALDSTARLAASVATIVGDANVLRSPADLAFYSTDIYSQGTLAELVVRPPDVDALAAAVRSCVAAGRAVIPRGGGLSYTSGYLPVRAGTVVFDLALLDRIVEINADDMYVTVEAGCTWKKLYDALKERGLRTPYYGPASGFSSTVGGALSQGSFLKGSTQYGTTAETTLGLEVVLADGSLVRTGSGASLHRPSPFFRTYGPDLTGLFLGDTGALGFKARATLRLIPFPAEARFATFTIDDDARLLAAMREIARRGLAAECHGWDPYIAHSFASRGEGFAKDLNYLAGVAKSGRSLAAGLKDAARIALKGKRIFDDAAFLIHVIVEDSSAPGADAKLAAIREIVARAGGNEIEPSVPRAIYGTPFSYPNGILGTKGERWVPINVLAPHSRVGELLGAIRAYFERQAQLIEEPGIEYGIIFFAVGNNTICIEPLFYWPDARTNYHERMIEKPFLDKLPKLAPNPAASAAMHQLRLGFTDLAMRMGCVHVQIGKTYRYRESREPATYALLEAIKQAVDPHRLVNPGSLGLE